MLNRNASKILAGFAIGAGVMAVGFAIEATPKAMILLEEKKAELGVEKLDAKTIVKNGWSGIYSDGREHGPFRPRARSVR